MNSENKLPIITASERLNSRSGIKGCILGKTGVGKTSLLWTLNPETTLFIDLEAGDLAVQGWQGDTIRPRSWQECRNLACFIGGSNPANYSDQSYSNNHYEKTCDKYGDPKKLEKYETIFIDSITVASRMCLRFAMREPDSISDRTGRQDLRSAYGLYNQEMLSWLIHLQYTRGKNVWFVGILDEKVDEYNQKYFSMQIQGNKTGYELPGIVDQVITMAELKEDANSNESYRAFITQSSNQYGFPAKDRSGKLEMIEPAHLGKLMKKINSESKPIWEKLTYKNFNENKTNENNLTKEIKK